MPSPRKKLDEDGVPVTGFAAMLVTVLITVPLVGKVTFVVPLTVKVAANAPDVVKLPPNVIVFVELLTPVPP